MRGLLDGQSLPPLDEQDGMPVVRLRKNEDALTQNELVRSKNSVFVQPCRLLGLQEAEARAVPASGRYLKSSHKLGEYAVFQLKKNGNGMNAQIGCTHFVH